jgi:putative hydrolase of the HAD superfamily
MRDGIEGVAFDLDGTLYPNYRLHIRILPHVLKEFLLVSAFARARKIIRIEQKKPSYVMPGDFYRFQAEITAKNLSISGENLKEKIDKVIYRAWEPPFKKIKLFKGVKETLGALREAGYKLGLLSDFPTEAKLELLGLNGLWNAVLCSESCGALKPHPASFKELASCLSLPAEKILYVGNSRAYDVGGAARAGMKTAWIKSPLFPGKGLKKPQADFTFSDYRQLRDYMIN